MTNERLEEASSRLYDDMIEQARPVDVVQGSSLIRNCLLLDYDHLAYRFKDQRGDEHIISREKVTDLIARKAANLSGDDPSEVAYRRGIGELSVDGKTVRLGTRAHKVFDVLSQRGLGNLVGIDDLASLFQESANPKNAANDGIRNLRKELATIPLIVNTVKGRGYALMSTYNPKTQLKIEE